MTIDVLQMKNGHKTSKLKDIIYSLQRENENFKYANELLVDQKNEVKAINSELAQNLEKSQHQLFDCSIITKDNEGNYSSYNTRLNCV